MSAGAVLPYLGAAIGIFAAARFADGDSVGSSIVQAGIGTLLAAAIWEFIVYVRRRDDL
jgi:hypothetical protein